MFRKKTWLILAFISFLLLTMTKVLASNNAKTNQFWWPKQLDLSPLRSHDNRSNPYGANFDYIKAFEKLDLNEVKQDIKNVLNTSQPWWPADYGNYGPFMIRMAWHSAGTYRVGDGRGGAEGGQQRFEPLNSWPDNANLDKARRLLWPVKQKYGPNISWPDLMVLTGNVALENAGFKTYGFAGGRTDDWEPDLVYWGPETIMLDDKRRTKDGGFKGDLAAVQMGLIYVNPEGPNANHNPLAAAKDIRHSFGLMAMNDEETVALIAGGHTLGKAHGATKASCVGPEPAAANLEDQGLGWINQCGKGNAEDTTTSGLEGAWTSTPTVWSMQYLSNLLDFEWIKTKSPSGATQWIPKDPRAANLVPDAHIKGKRHAPIMFTTDIALKKDPKYRKIAEKFIQNPKAFNLAFAKAWFKLTHRDMGPRSRYLGSEVPKEVSLWQDPVPKVNFKLINDEQVTELKEKILTSGLSTQALVKTAWASASSFRYTDKRGGANGARIRLLPQKNWAVNNPKELGVNLQKLEKIQQDFNSSLDQEHKISLADVIVLGGDAAIEQAAKKAGYPLQLPYRLGRTDATQGQTDIHSFAFLEPKADAFRNYYSQQSYYNPTKAMIDKANLLGLNVVQMTALVGGMRVLNTNTDNSQYGVLTKNKGRLSNDFFVNLLDMSTRWKKSKTPGLYDGFDRKTGKLKWQATSVDLIFGSNSELRAVAEAFASKDGQKLFIHHFAKAWTQVIQADRFDKPVVKH